MRITLVRDDGKVNTMRTLRIEQLVEQMKVETKAQSVSKMREVLPFMLPGDKNDYVQKVQKVIPAAAFFRKDGITTMSEYNGIVMIQVNTFEIIFFFQIEMSMYYDTLPVFFRDKSKQTFCINRSCVGFAQMKII